MSTFRRIAWIAVILALLPAAVLTWQRIGAEENEQTATALIDEIALREQAFASGWDPFELALHYREAGLPGIVVYEETPETLAQAGKILALPGYELAAAAAAAGREMPDIPAGITVLSEIEPGALGALHEKFRDAPITFELAGRTWYAVPGEVMDSLPLGPDRERIAAYHEAGFDIAYRPLNHPSLASVGEDFPPEANYLIHMQLQVAGQPDLLSETIAASQAYLTGIIEGTEQSGMVDIAQKVPTVRLLSFNQDYVNQQLTPDDLIEKYLLAANERNISLLYLRPYTEPHLGNMVENTEQLISGLVAELETSGFTVGSLQQRHLEFSPAAVLRLMSAIGILAGLLLLALAYPQPWGAVVAVAVAGLALVAAGPSWAALALVAALVFPVLGFSYLSERLVSLFGATAISLAGAILLVAVGSDAPSMNGIEPFRGVAATLVVPPALFVFQYALRFKRPATWITSLWGHRVRLGEVVIAVLVLAAVGLVVIRRGNFPIIGASEIELALRSFLSDLFVRPRFKELLGHSLAVVGLMLAILPAWMRAGLLTGGVIAQATILNSFSHYHTPVLISLQRTIIALVLGFLIGLVLVAVTRVVIHFGRRWLESDGDGETLAGTDGEGTGRPPGSSPAKAT